MLRRSLLEISSRSSFRRSTTRITRQIPSYLSSRRQYCRTPDKPPESGSSLPKLVVGGATLGAVVLTAYYLNQQPEVRGKVLESAKFDHKGPPELSRSYKDLQEDKNSEPQDVTPGTEEPDSSRADMPARDQTETPSDFPNLDDSNKKEGESQFKLKDENESAPEEYVIPVKDTEVSSSTESSVTFDDNSISSKKLTEEREDLKIPEMKTDIEQHEAIESSPLREIVDAVPEPEAELNSSSQQEFDKDLAEGEQATSEEQPSSLLDEYQHGSITTTSPDMHKDMNNAKEDGKLILDFLQAIHAAEKRQAELDSHIFGEEKRKLKEKYDKELKDARARELMYAEEAAILDKELKKERVKAIAALKSLQEELEQKLQTKIEQKEAETEVELKKMEELAKAELAAALAREKASHIEKMAEADLHINALCMAFYARSEEARQSHSIHKLALGALALEDALSKGLPVKKEIDALNIYLEGANKDPLLELVLSSLPQETWDSGSDTILQLKSEFDALKGSLRHFSLIPPGGGGILAHSLARFASLLKVRETNTSGDGIESLMNKVESFLAEGKLSEAADTLENGVKGTQAAEVIGDWLGRARNRAITEQALTVIQSYATSIGLS